MYLLHHVCKGAGEICVALSYGSHIPGHGGNLHRQVERPQSGGDPEHQGGDSIDVFGDLPLIMLNVLRYV